MATTSAIVSTTPATTATATKQGHQTNETDTGSHSKRNWDFFRNRREIHPGENLEDVHLQELADYSAVVEAGFQSLHSFQSFVTCDFFHLIARR